MLVNYYPNLPIYVFADGDPHGIHNAARHLLECLHRGPMYNWKPYEPKVRYLGLRVKDPECLCHVTPFRPKEIKEAETLKNAKWINRPEFSA